MTVKKIPLAEANAYQKENYLPPLSKSWWLKWLKKEVTE